jgi:hypothetical protein
MPGATAADIAGMNAKEATVRAALERAEDDTASIRDMWSVLRTGAQDAALANLVAARNRYTQWADGQGEQGWKRWAVRGTEPDGFAYPVRFWLGIGDDLLSELGVHVQAAEDGGTAAVVKNTASQTAKDVADVAQKAVEVVTKPWPLTWKLAAGAAVGLTGLGLVVVLAKELRPLLGLLPQKEG